MILTLISALALAAGLPACGADGGSDGRLDVVASVFPLAEAAERVGGDLVAVRNLTPPGVEPHDLELAPDDLVALAQADLVILVGGDFQPAVEDALGQIEGEVLEAVSLVPTLRADGAVDPHVWLDPMRFATIVEAVGDALAALDPEHAGAYRANAAAYRAELEGLDAAFRRGLASCRTRLLVTSHAAFGYLADAYGLEQVSIAGLSPESEPSPARLAELRSLVEREGVTTIFTEELVSPAVAETLAAEAGVRTAVLSPLEGRSPEQARRGEGYVAMMRTNLERLEVALGCA